MSYKVKLQSFEGPFDLLVYLIENAQMSIYDIEISKITAQYLEYIQAMQEMDIAVATEFMVLASSLIEIKSKMILPRMTEMGETASEEDPRTELVARILEYKKFKRAAEILQEQEEKASRIFRKPQEDISQFLEQPDEYLSLDLKQFAGAFAAFMEKRQKIDAVRKHYTRIEREKTSVESRIKYIIDKLRHKIGEVFNFGDLVPDKADRYDTVITFVSLLEMAKERVVNVRQQTIYGNIEVEPGEKINEGGIRYEQQKIIKSAFESMMFTWGEPLDAKTAADVFNITKQEAIECFKELQDEYEQEGRGIVVRQINQSFQFVTREENADYVRRLCTPVKLKKLSQSALEVLAIVAYRQPVTKGEIEAIRGIRCDRVMDGLMKKELVCEKGRADTVGRPILYGTTDVFLQNFGFTSIKDLPEIDDIETMVSGYLAEDAEAAADIPADGQIQIEI